MLDLVSWFMLFIYTFLKCYYFQLVLGIICCSGKSISTVLFFFFSFYGVILMRHLYNCVLQRVTIF